MTPEKRGWLNEWLRKEKKLKKRIAILQAVFTECQHIIMQWHDADLCEQDLREFEKKIKTAKKQLKILEAIR